MMAATPSKRKRLEKPKPDATPDSSPNKPRALYDPLQKAPPHPEDSDFLYRYTGEHTLQLEQLYFLFQENKISDPWCIVCKDEREDEILHCATCRRTYHKSCLKPSFRNCGGDFRSQGTSTRNRYYCPLCTKRTFHAFRPPRDEMERARQASNRKAAFNACHKNFDRFMAWQNLHDTGDEESDFRLLWNIGAVEESRVQNSRVPGQKQNIHMNGAAGYTPRPLNHKHELDDIPSSEPESSYVSRPVASALALLRSKAVTAERFQARLDKVDAESERVKFQNMQLRTEIAAVRGAVSAVVKAWPLIEQALRITSKSTEPKGLGSQIVLLKDFLSNTGPPADAPRSEQSEKSKGVGKRKRSATRNKSLARNSNGNSGQGQNDHDDDSSENFSPRRPLSERSKVSIAGEISDVKRMLNSTKTSRLRKSILEKRLVTLETELNRYRDGYSETDSDEEEVEEEEEEDNEQSEETDSSSVRDHISEADSSDDQASRKRQRISNSENNNFSDAGEVSDAQEEMLTEHHYCQLRISQLYQQIAALDHNLTIAKFDIADLASWIAIRYDEISPGDPEARIKIRKGYTGRALSTSGLQRLVRENEIFRNQFLFGRRKKTMQMRLEAWREKYHAMQHGNRNITRDDPKHIEVWAWEDALSEEDRSFFIKFEEEKGTYKSDPVRPPQVVRKPRLRSPTPYYEDESEVEYAKRCWGDKEGVDRHIKPSWGENDSGDSSGDHQEERENGEDDEEEEEKENRAGEEVGGRGDGRGKRLSVDGDGDVDMGTRKIDKGKGKEGTTNEDRNGDGGDGGGPF